MQYPWENTPAHILEITVGKQHIDILGHANNCEYVKWMENTALSHCNALEMGVETWQAIGFAWVARYTEIDYLLPAFEKDTIMAGTWISENDGRISMVRQYQFIRKSDGKTLIKGHTRWICINLKTGKAARMPKEFCESFA